MRSIWDGVQRFQRDVFPALEPHYAALARGQQPETLFITCSDSRIDPSLLTQTQPGELFVVRNAGNIVPPRSSDEVSVESAVSFAIDELGVRQIVLCGHSDCGAMQGLLDLDALDSLPAVQRWVTYASPALDEVDVANSDQLEQLIRANVHLQLEHLVQYASVRAAVDGGRLAIQGWFYQIPTGQIELLAEIGEQVAR